MDEPPVIDISGDPERVAEAVGQACRKWGFFQIVGHGVDRDVVSI